MESVLKISKWFMAVLAVFILTTGFICSSASSVSASINYGEEVSEAAKLFEGKPFRYGGTTPKGFDASGFTQYVYQYAATGMKIPRTSADQYKSGIMVKPKELKQGDLVFYATGKKGKVSFVAVYTGDGKFIGATSKGVKRVNMSDKYWKDRYLGAKRYIK